MQEALTENCVDIHKQLSYIWCNSFRCMMCCTLGQRARELLTVRNQSVRFQYSWHSGRGLGLSTLLDPWTNGCGVSPAMVHWGSLWRRHRWNVGSWLPHPDARSDTCRVVLGVFTCRLFGISALAFGISASSVASLTGWVTKLRGMDDAALAFRSSQHAPGRVEPGYQHGSRREKRQTLIC